MRMRSPVVIRFPSRRFGHPPAAGLAAGARREARWRALEMILRRLFQLVVHRRIALQYFSASHRTAMRLAPTMQMMSRLVPQPFEREIRNVVTRQMVRDLVRSEGARATMHDNSPGLPPTVPRVAPVRRERGAVYPRLNVIVMRAPGAAAAVTREAAGAPAAASRESTAVGRTPRDLARSAPEFASLPPQELSRVTDHVIRQLDRRVLSYRERTGRII